MHQKKEQIKVRENKFSSNKMKLEEKIEIMLPPAEYNSLRSQNIWCKLTKQILNSYPLPFLGKFCWINEIVTL